MRKPLVATDERIPSEDVQCFDSITEPCSEKHEEKISNMISYNANVHSKSRLERDLNSHLRDFGPGLEESFVHIKCTTNIFATT